ncbi:MAG: hypothetical protein WDN72_05945 [Alphaproteobacteria bacterium]
MSDPDDGRRNLPPFVQASLRATGMMTQFLTPDQKSILLERYEQLLPAGTL